MKDKINLELNIKWLNDEYDHHLKYIRESSLNIVFETNDIKKSQLKNISCISLRMIDIINEISILEYKINN